jgi:hypothetical protein
VELTTVRVLLVRGFHVLEEVLDRVDLPHCARVECVDAAGGGRLSDPPWVFDREPLLPSLSSA